MATVATINKVFKTSSTVINPSDISNFYAGGELRNEMVAGGDYWSPTSINKFNQSVSVDNNTFITTGEPLKIIGFGFNDLLQSLNGMYNLANTLNQVVSETRTIRITVTATDSSTSSTIYENSRDYDIDSTFSGSLETTSLSDLSEAWNNRIDLKGLLDGITNGNYISIGLTLKDILSNEEVSFETRLTGAVLGTIETAFSNLAIKSIMSLANVTTINPLTMIFAGLLSAIFSEFVEMSIGLDKSFGFGGELVGVDSFGRAVYSKEINFFDGLVASVIETVTFGFADTIFDENQLEAQQEIDAGYMGYAEMMSDFEYNPSLALNVGLPYLEMIMNLYDVSDFESSSPYSEYGVSIGSDGTAYGSGVKGSSALANAINTDRTFGLGDYYTNRALDSLNSGGDGSSTSTYDGSRNTYEGDSVGFDL